MIIKDQKPTTSLLFWYFVQRVKSKLLLLHYLLKRIKVKIAKIRQLQ